mgnify:CR=1 FL=1
MIFDTTYYSKEIKEEIDLTLGKPFSPINVIKIGVIGSSRMIIDSNSSGFDKLVKLNTDLTHASIGLRPKGILVILAKSYKNLSWVIPYHHLSIYKTDVLSIHSAGEFLKLRLNGKQNMKFISKVLYRKLNYLKI